jgi:transcriptional regulator with XRE-family HTH domain
MDVPSVIRQRLTDLGIEQRELATSAQVTESYISQLLTRKKDPPAPNRTDIYDKMEHFLRLPQGELSKLADLQRKEALQRQLGDPLTPLFKEVRALILRKCAPDNERHMRSIFEKQPECSKL